MEFGFFFRGLVIGFSIAAPVGPIGVLCIRRTLTDGQVSGLVSGLGAATADGLYGCVAGFGLTFVSSFLIDQRGLFRLIGGIFLLYLGVRAFLARPPEPVSSKSEKGFVGAYVSTLFLTLTNPMTVLSFAGIFAGLGIAEGNRDYLSAGILVVGVFLGSAFWWLILSSGIGFFRRRFDLKILQWVNRISGLILGTFGIVSLLSLKF